MTLPKDQMKTHRHAASSSQFSAAKVNAHHKVRRLLTSSVMRSATLASSAVTRSGSIAGILRAMTLIQLAAVR